MVCPDSWGVSSPGLIYDFLVAIPSWIERGAGVLLSGPSHAEQAGGWGGIAVGAWLWPLAGDNVFWGHAGMQCWGVGGAESG